MATARVETIPQPDPPRKIIIELDEDEAGRLMLMCYERECIRGATLNDPGKITLYDILRKAGVVQVGRAIDGNYSIVAPHPVVAP